MNRSLDVDLVLREYLADDGLTAPDHVLHVVEQRISRLPRRRAWRLPGRLFMNTYTKLAAAAAAIVIVAVVGYSLIPRGALIGGPSPATSPTLCPSPTPGSTPMALHDCQLVGGGRYLLQPFADAPDLTFTADIPAGWHGSPPVAILGPLGPEGPRGIAIAFLRVDGLFRDPCHWDLDGSGSPRQPGDLPVGPGASETDEVSPLSHALAGNPSYSTDPDGVVWSGFPADEGIGEVAGHQVTIRVPASVDIDACDKDSDGEGRYYVFSGQDAGLYAQGNGNIWDIHILGLDRLRLNVPVRLIIVLSYFEDTPASDLAAGKAIVGSFDFVP